MGIANSTDATAKTKAQVLRVRALLLEKGLTVRAIGRRHSVSNAFVSQVLHGVAWSIWLQRAIAQELGVTPSSLWPERYHEDGQPIDRRRRAS